jgi:hypothetical protein
VLLLVIVSEGDWIDHEQEHEHENEFEKRFISPLAKRNRVDKS